MACWLGGLGVVVVCCWQIKSSHAVDSTARGADNDYKALKLQRARINKQAKDQNSSQIRTGTKTRTHTHTSTGRHIHIDAGAERCRGLRLN